jgi:hypothetical protein
MPAMSSHLFRNPENPTEIIKDTPWGDIPAWKASALATGTMGAYTEYVKQVRADAVLAHDAVNVREQAVSAREAAVAERERAVVDLIGQASLLFDRLDKRIKADEERKPEEPLPLPPGTEADETHEPTGDLHQIQAKGEDDLEGDLKHPENSELTRHKYDNVSDQAGKVEFPQPGDPDLPEPRSPAAFEDN